MNLGHMLFSFRGRINRAKWWLSILIVTIFNIVVGYVLQNLPHGAEVIGFIAWLLGLWVSLAVGAKRLHDLNRSGAWLVVFIGVPILLLIVFLGFAGMSVGTALLTGGGTGQELSPEAIAQIITQLGGVGLILGVLWLALAVWALIWLGCLRGTVGPNQYGPDPLEGRI